MRGSGREEIHLTLSASRYENCRRHSTAAHNHGEAGMTPERFGDGGPERSGGRAAVRGREQSRRSSRPIMMKIMIVLRQPTTSSAKRR
jgi:hypothetical protein